MSNESTSPDRVDRVMQLARSILSRGQSRPAFQPEDALVDVGFTSLDLANLMIALEAEFDIMIPPSFLTPAHFGSVGSIARMVEAIPPQDTAPA